VPPRTVYSEYATPGTPVYIKPRNGYSVDIYIEKTVNGEKTSFYAYTSSYSPQTAAYFLYMGETAPTPTPSPTPIPTPVPTATQRPFWFLPPFSTPTPAPTVQPG